MPRSAEKPTFDIRKDILAVIFLALGVFLGLCLISYSPTDPAINSASNVAHIRNLGGVVGSYISDFLFTVFGISAYITSAVCLLISALQLKGLPIKIRVRDVFYYCGLVVFASTLIHLRFETIPIRGRPIPGGGIVGGLIGDILAAYLNRPGAYVIAFAGFALFFLLSTNLSITTLISAATKAIKTSFLGLLACCSWLFMNLVVAIKKAPAFLKALFTEKIPSLFRRKKKHEPKIHINELTSARKRSQKDDDVASLKPIKAKDEEDDEESDDEDYEEEEEDIDEEDGEEGEEDGEEDAEEDEEHTGHKDAAATLSVIMGPKILKRADAAKKRAVDEQLRFTKMSAEGYEPPPIGLLGAEDRKKVDVDEAALKKNSLLLESKLKDFDVEGHVTAIHPGPVITMFEFEPAAGTKLNKIVNLQDDLSLAMGGRSVRTIPHLPGKAALGIEVPNGEREIVWLRDILSTPQFMRSSTKLPLVLGASTSGHPMIDDLAKMPHLLVAGATGSGKSVAINSIIISILYRSSPADVRLILVDPKMLELSIYDGIPHLLLPVVTKPKPAVQAMRWAIKEMERRYRLMNDSGTRNILGYNEKIEKGLVEIKNAEQVAEALGKNPEAIVHTGKIPYIVIVIDELADLMMTASQDMEEAITRLAQMARAAGIHLILATQRPSVDVITGLIKANFPARIAFKVTARHDSRTILDCMGAETLLGQGDMLFMKPSGGHLVRVHGSYVTDSDISRVVTHIKGQGEPVYDESILAEPEGGEEGGDFEGENDELYDKAVKLVAETKQASISMVQRRLRIGYNRAARMIERMESDGIVGPAEGSKPRQVLVSNL